VNLTNPMMMKGPVREFIPSPPQEVTVRIPQGKKPAKVKLLVSAHVPQIRQSNGAISLTIPSIRDHEVIALDL